MSKEIKDSQSKLNKLLKSDLTNDQLIELIKERAVTCLDLF